VKISGQGGNGEFLGNMLGAIAGLFNSAGVSAAMDSALAAAAGLVNTGGLAVTGVNTLAGPLVSAPVANVPLMTLTLPAVQDDALGAIVEISPVTLNIDAHAGNGLVLGNALAKLANLFQPARCRAPSTPTRSTRGWLSCWRSSTPPRPPSRRPRPSRLRR
jgi:hypothetical protein